MHYKVSLWRWMALLLFHCLAQVKISTPLSLSPHLSGSSRRHYQILKRRKLRMCKAWCSACSSECLCAKMVILIPATVCQILPYRASELFSQKHWRYELHVKIYRKMRTTSIYLINPAHTVWWEPWSVWLWHPFYFLLSSAANLPNIRALHHANWTWIFLKGRDNHVWWMVLHDMNPYYTCGTY